MSVRFTSGFILLLFVFNCFAVSLTKHEIAELQERLILAGHPPSWIDGIRGERTQTAIDMYLNSKGLKNQTPKVVLEMLRSEQSEFVSIKRTHLDEMNSAIEELRGKLLKVEGALEEKERHLDTKLKNVDSFYYGFITQLIAERTLAYMLAFLALVVSTAGGIYLYFKRKATEKVAEAVRNIRKNTKREYEKRSIKTLDKIISETNSHSDEAIENLKSESDKTILELKNESEYAFGNLAGRMCLVIWKILNFDSKQSNFLDKEAKQLLNDVYDELRKDTKSALMRVDGLTFKKRLNQHFLNLMYYAAEEYIKNKSNKNLNVITELLEYCKPIVDEETESEQYSAEWAERVDCVCLAEYAINKIDKKEAILKLAKIEPYLQEEDFEDIINAYPDITLTEIVQ